MLARDGGYICVTNDRRLRLECEELGVQVLWGLELMVELVKWKHLSSRAAIATAEGIHAKNPRYITTRILERFGAKVRELAAR